MISMIIFKCDRCGKSYEEKNYSSEYSVSKKSSIGFSLSLDLCPECQMELDEFMKNPGKEREYEH